MLTNAIAEIGRVHEHMPAFALSIDETGRLSVIAPDRPIVFRCRCLGFGFEGRALPSAASPVLELGAILRPLPFSIELPQLRQQLLHLVKASESLPHARLIKLPDGRVGATGSLPLELPVTQQRLIGAATVLVLELMPYLALAAELFAPLTARAAA
jgi:hypothetical protein